MLIIGPEEQRKIERVIAYAKAHPVLFDQIREGVVDHKIVLKLKDRKPTMPRPQSAGVLFPGGFRAAYSIEQQPPGLCAHLSIGVEGRPVKGAMPSEPAVMMIAQAFGVKYPGDRMWIEEFEPGEYAINIVMLIERTQGGNA
jgi:hypothetical protein